MAWIIHEHSLVYYQKIYKKRLTGFDEAESVRSCCLTIEKVTYAPF